MRGPVGIGGKGLHLAPVSVAGRKIKNEGTRRGVAESVVVGCSNDEFRASSEFWVHVFDKKKRPNEQAATTHAETFANQQ